MTRNKAVNKTINRLAEETSPYLLQHRDNPVHWQPWDEAALAMAQAEDKPILLSIGYAACHWCHVMAHESFENDATAGQMNGAFINIKVDREERPDLDAIYQSALNVLGEQGGWPLTMFLKPDGTPFWGGTYFPPESRYGRPGFPDVLEQISTIYTTRRDQIEQNADALKDALRQAGQTNAHGVLTLDTLDNAAQAATRIIDYHHGGTSGAPKFPQPVFFRFLWNSYLRTRDQRQFEAVIITLNNICQGGIYDHLGGGFSRYSVDDYWLAPHFEKMLYDNALLVELLCDTWQETKLPLHETRIRETIGWMLSDLRSDATDATDASDASDAADASDGLYALASAYDADSEGEEGKYYVWSLEAVESLLGDHAAEFSAAYDVTQNGNWEGHTILRRRVDDTDRDTDRDTGRAGRLSDCRQKLLSERIRRIPPQRDDKVLADWNGMAIYALVRAGILFDEPVWTAAAQDIYNFIQAHMQNGARLCHTWCAGRAQHPAVIDDYANMARAGLALYQVTHDAAFLNRAEDWVQIANAHYWDDVDGGYYLAADDTNDLIVRTKTLYDNAVPSGNGIMLDVLARLYHMTGKTSFRDRARSLLAALTPSDNHALMNRPSLGLGFETLENGLQVIVVAPDVVTPEATAGAEGAEKKDPVAADLYRTALKAAPSQAVVSLVPTGQVLPDGHPASGKGPVDGKAAAYVCRGPVCGLPVTTTGDLIAQLSGNG